MNDFLAFIQEYILLVVSAVFAIVELISTIGLLITGKRFKSYLAAAKERETYTVCPHCGSEIKLSNLTFRLPDGSKDDDLDGKPDKE